MINKFGGQKRLASIGICGVAPAVALATNRFAEVRTGSVIWKFLRAKKSKLRDARSPGAKASAPASRVAFSNAAFAPQLFPILGLPNVAPARRKAPQFHIY
jgi:hypothetical protein